MNKDNFSIKDNEIVGYAQRVLEDEATELLNAAKRLNHYFVKAIHIIFNCKGKVVLTGLGKSGYVAQKISATLASTGTPSFYLYPTEALHGDLGKIGIEDVLVAVAFGGETKEVIEVAKYSKRLQIPIISITGNINSSLAQISDIVIDGSVSKEACPMNLAPTSSSTLALAIGDAIAISLMKLKNFTEANFAQFHPGGVIGWKLSLVKDHMRIQSELPLLLKDANFNDILNQITNPNFGIVGIMSEQGQLIGCITDGDLRRALIKYGKELLDKKAYEIMSSNPKVICANTLAVEAINQMEKQKVTSLFVVNSPESKIPIGLIRMHDLLAAKII